MATIPTANYGAQTVPIDPTALTGLAPTQVQQSNIGVSQFGDVAEPAEKLKTSLKSTVSVIRDYENFKIQENYIDFMNNLNNDFEQYRTSGNYGDASGSVELYTNKFNNAVNEFGKTLSLEGSQKFKAITNEFGARFLSSVRAFETSEGYAYRENKLNEYLDNNTQYAIQSVYDSSNTLTSVGDFQSSTVGYLNAADNTDRAMATFGARYVGEDANGIIRPKFKEQIDRSQVSAEYKSKYYANENRVLQDRWGNKPTGEAAINFAQSLKSLDVVTDMFGEKLIINSAFRSKAYNSTLKGAATNSQHVQGTAFDVSTVGWSDDKKRTFIAIANQGGFDSFGEYNNFIHIDRRGKNSYWNNAGSKAVMPKGGLAELVKSYGLPSKNAVNTQADAVKNYDIATQATSSFIGSSNFNYVNPDIVNSIDFGVSDRIIDSMPIEASKREQLKRDARTRATTTILEAVAEKDPAALLRTLRDDKGWDDYLTSSAHLALLQTADAKLKVKQAENRNKLSTELADYRSGLAETGVRNKSLEYSMISQLSQEDALNEMAKIESTVLTYAATQEYKANSTEENVKFTNDLLSEARVAMANGNLKLANNLLSARSSLSEGLTKDVASNFEKYLAQIENGGERSADYEQSIRPFYEALGKGSDFDKNIELAEVSSTILQAVDTGDTETLAEIISLSTTAKLGKNATSEQIEQMAHLVAVSKAAKTALGTLFEAESDVYTKSLALGAPRDLQQEANLTAHLSTKNKTLAEEAFAEISANALLTEYVSETGSNATLEFINNREAELKAKLDDPNLSPDDRRQLLTEVNKLGALRQAKLADDKLRNEDRAVWITHKDKTGQAETLMKTFMLSPTSENFTRLKESQDRVYDQEKVPQVDRQYLPASFISQTQTLFDNFREDSALGGEPDQRVDNFFNSIGAQYGENVPTVAKELANRTNIRALEPAIHLVNDNPANRVAVKELLSGTGANDYYNALRAVAVQSRMEKGWEGRASVSPLWLRAAADGARVSKGVTDNNLYGKDAIKHEVTNYINGVTSRSTSDFGTSTADLLMLMAKSVRGDGKAITVGSVMDKFKELGAPTDRSDIKPFGVSKAEFNNWYWQLDDSAFENAYGQDKFGGITKIGKENISLMNLQPSGVGEYFIVDDEGYPVLEPNEQGGYSAFVLNFDYSLGMEGVSTAGAPKEVKGGPTTIWDRPVKGY